MAQSRRWRLSSRRFVCSGPWSLESGDRVELVEFTPP
jgi:hypothetical protein